MRELFTMWKNTRMIVLTAVIAAVYAAVLIPFKAIQIVPGFTELRVAQLIPPVASLLFGPAAAWGVAIGNLVGDMIGGTFGLGSAFGFIGNFFLGAVPYLLWGRLGFLSSRGEPDMHGVMKVVEFIIVTAVSGIACAAIIAWGLEALGVFPFTLLGLIIAGNNVVFPAILSPFLMAALYNPVKRLGLIWYDVLDAEDVGQRSTAGAGAWLNLIATLAGWLICLLISLGAKGKSQSVVLVGAPFMAALLVSLFLGSGRTFKGPARVRRPA